MPIKTILEYPDPRLKQKTKPLETFDDSTQKMVEDMFDTLYSGPNNAGLAAPQIGLIERITVIDISPDRKQPLCLINPEIIKAEGTFENQEGCLSFPELFITVQRSEYIRFKALDRNGEPYEMDADGLLSICVQHELDHLDGIVFVDRLSPLKKQRALKKLEKLRRLMAS
jgi:peptide deformylase